MDQFQQKKIEFEFDETYFDHNQVIVRGIV